MMSEYVWRWFFVLVCIGLSIVGLCGCETTDGMTCMRTRGVDSAEHQASEGEGLHTPRDLSMQREDPEKLAFDIGGERVVFVRVGAGPTMIDGITFEVERPFYICTTELSQRQVAAIYGIGVDEYRFGWTFRLLLDARQDLAVRGAFADGLEAYLSMPEKPFLMAEIGEASLITAALSQEWDRVVRLPSLAEWYRAMRAEKSSLYWWGDEPRFGHAAIGYGRSESSPAGTLSAIRDCAVGEANPLGLRNVIGNAGELVFPTDKERAQIRSSVRAASKDRISPAIDSGSYLGAHTAFSVGADAGTGNVSNFTDESNAWSELHLWLQSMRRIILGQQTEELSWGATSGWATGLRLVIESDAIKLAE